MIESFEIIALEKELDEYRSKLRESDHRDVFGPHNWVVDHVKKMVGAGRMSPTEASEKIYKSGISSKRKAEARYESNQLSDDGLIQVRAEYRIARAKELQYLSEQP